LSHTKGDSESDQGSQADSSLDNESLENQLDSDSEESEDASEESSEDESELEKGKFLFNCFCLRLKLGNHQFNTLTIMFKAPKKKLFAKFSLMSRYSIRSLFYLIN
jgi:hypothetical protein